MKLAAQPVIHGADRSKTEREFYPLAHVDEALQAIFKSSSQETLLQKTRRIMGANVSNLGDDELEVHMTNLQHLIDYWLDEYERCMFDGQTLHQLLREG